MSGRVGWLSFARQEPLYAVVAAFGRDYGVHVPFGEAVEVSAGKFFRAYSKCNVTFEPGRQNLAWS